MKYTKEKLQDMNIDVSCVHKGTFNPIFIAKGPNNVMITYYANRFELEDLKTDFTEKVVDMLIVKLRKEKLKNLNEIYRRTT